MDHATHADTALDGVPQQVQKNGADPRGGHRQSQSVMPSREVLFTEWEKWMEHRQLSPNTVKLYTRTVERAWNVLDLPRATEEDLQKWLQAQGGKAGTIGNRICALTSFFRFLAKTKRRPDNPAAELERPKIHKRIPKPVEGLEAVLALCDKADVIANDKGAIPRRVGETKDMVTFLCYTGLRIHEAVKCEWPVPCPEEAFVIGKGDKEELMQIHPKAREAWDRLGRWPIGARATQRRFEKAGIHPHMCRHYFVTSLVRQGVDFGTVSKMARHSSTQTTMGYASFQKKQFREALDRMV